MPVSEVLLLLNVCVFLMKKMSPGEAGWARAGSTSLSPPGGPSLFYVLKLSTAAARKQLLQLQVTGSLS